MFGRLEAEEGFGRGWEGVGVAISEVRNSVKVGDGLDQSVS